MPGGVNEPIIQDYFPGDNHQPNKHGRRQLFRTYWTLLLQTFVRLWTKCNISYAYFDLVFASSVLWTEKIHRTKLNWTVVQSIFRLWLPKFGVIPVAGCLISKIIQNCSKTSWNRLQPVKRSHALHSYVTTFITFNLIFSSSKTVKNWERYN